MSNVSSILTGITSILTSTLPASWKELDYVYSDEKNTFRSGENRFGAGVEGAETTSGVVKAITLNQTFFVKLTDCIANRSDDKNERETISELYEQMELIQAKVFQQKLGVPDKVLLVSDLSLDAPEKIGDNTLMLKMSFTAQHRQATAN